MYGDLDVQQRIEELETRLAFLDHSLQTLNEVVTRQSRQLDLLQARVKELSMQLQEVAPSLIRQASDETPPPHY